MPELARPTGYNLQTHVFNPIPVNTYFNKEVGVAVPDLTQVAKTQGEAAMSGAIAQTLRELPDLIYSNTKRGRELREGKAKMEMGERVRGMANDAIDNRNGRNLEDFKMTGSGEVAYAPEGVLSRNYKQAQIDYLKARRDNAGKTAASKVPIANSNIPAFDGEVETGSPADLPATEEEVVTETDEEVAADQGYVEGEGDGPGRNADNLPALPADAAAPVAILKQQNPPPVEQPPVAQPILKAAPATRKQIEQQAELPTGGAPALTDASLIDPEGAQTAQPVLAKPQAQSQQPQAKKTGPKINRRIDAGESFVDYYDNGAIVQHFKQVVPGKPGMKVLKAGGSRGTVSPDLSRDAHKRGISTEGKTEQQILDEIKAWDSSDGRNGALTEQQQKSYDRITDDLRQEVTYKDFQIAKRGYGSVIEGSSEATSAGDIAMINGFQQLADPGATVREGDVALIQRAQGLLQQIGNIPQVLQGQAQLTPEMRKSLKSMSERLYKARQAAMSDELGPRYKKRIKRSGLPDDVYEDFFDASTSSHETKSEKPAAPKVTPEQAATEGAKRLEAYKAGKYDSNPELKARMENALKNLGLL